MSRTLKIILGVVIVLVLMGASSGAGYALGMQTGVERTRAIWQQFVNERMGGGAPSAASAASGTGGALSASGASSRQGSGFGGGGSFGGQTPAGGGLTGVIGKISDNSVEITMRNQTFTAALTDQTKIYTSASGSRADLKPGDTVVVSGNRGADGTLTASSIQVVTLPTP